MSWIQEELERRGLPDLLRGAEDAGSFAARRGEIRKLLAEREYGKLPPAPVRVDFEEEEPQPFGGGTAVLTRVRVTSTLPDGQTFTFPFSAMVPAGGDSIPAFVHINFWPDIPDKYMPSEEISDNGFAVFSFSASDVQTDDQMGDFTNGIGPLLFPDGRRGPDGPSKLTMWAWAAMRVMDYVQTQPRIDQSTVAVVGHSRMGKTALITGGWDERFRFVISNDSGCGGAALSRGKTGETIAFMSEVLWFWYCENFLEYEGDPARLPFDQHFLLSLAAPRHLYVASGSEDAWADPAGEFLGAAAASPAWAIHGLPGLIAPDRPPEPGDVFHEGYIGYHCRRGGHFLSRWDWLRFMEYIRLHRND